MLLVQEQLMTTLSHKTCCTLQVFLSFSQVWNLKLLHAIYFLGVTLSTSTHLFKVWYLTLLYICNLLSWGNPVYLNSLVQGLISHASLHMQFTFLTLSISTHLFKVWYLTLLYSLGVTLSTSTHLFKVWYLTLLYTCSYFLGVTLSTSTHLFKVWYLTLHYTYNLLSWGNPVYLDPLFTAQLS